MVRLFVCGDVVNQSHAGGKICSDELAEVISAADLAVCNFEAPLAGYGNPAPKVGAHLTQHERTMAGLKRQGFGVLALANNHILDYGAEGLAATIKNARDCGLLVLGAGLSEDAAYEPLIVEVNGRKLGMVNACEAQFGVIDLFSRAQAAGYAWINHSRVDMAILALRKSCDHVIVFAHAGLEHHSVPQREWRERYKHFCALGADLVVGGHPHVPQGFEYVDRSLVIYSLGNFFFDAIYFKNQEDRSYAAMVELEPGAAPRFVPVHHHKRDGVVELSPPEKRIDLQELCRLLGEPYPRELDRMSLSAYRRLSRRLAYSLVPIPYDGDVKSSLRMILDHVTGRHRQAVPKEMLQLHLMRNESYQYAMRHALEVLNARRNDQL